MVYPITTHYLSLLDLGLQHSSVCVNIVTNSAPDGINRIVHHVDDTTISVGLRVKKEEIIRTQVAKMATSNNSASRDVIKGDVTPSLVNFKTSLNFI